jgi:hypothetical protein
MKTTMQELLEWHRLSMRSYSETNKMIEALLEKEKEQICNAYTDGLEGPYIGAEEYYNQTYNK